jgi:hypothetical protein
MQPSSRCCTLKRVRDRLGFTDASNLFAHHRSRCDGRRPIDDGATGRRETMERSRRSFPTAAGGPSSRRRCVASLGQNALASFGQNPPLSPLVPSPSRSRLKCRTRASPSSGGEGAVTSTALAGPISRCQTAHLVPAARFCARVLHRCFTHPEPRGGRSAEKRSGACEAPVGRIMCVTDARERAYDAIRQAPSEAPCVP